MAAKGHETTALLRDDNDDDDDVEHGAHGGGARVGHSEGGAAAVRFAPSKWKTTTVAAAFVGTVLLAGLVALTIAVTVSAAKASEQGDGSADDGEAQTDYTMLRGYCDKISPIGTAELIARQQNVVNELIAQGADAFVTEPGPTMTYLSGVSWKISERPFLLVINKDGSVLWICPAFEEGSARERVGTSAPMLLWQEDQSPYGMLYGAVGSPTSGFTLLVEPEIRAYIADGFTQAFGAANQVSVGMALLRAVRGVKSPAEIDILRCANAATKAAIAQVQRQFFRAGITEDAVATELVKAQEMAGLTDTWSLVLFAENAAYPHGTANRLQLQDGNMVLIDTGGDLYGYQSDISRTFTFPYGQYTSEQLSWWNAVHDAQQAALDAIVIGQPASNLDDAARAVVARAGYGANYTTFTHRLGHGIGLQGHEEVYMVRGNSYPLRLGLCFSVEPGIYIIGKGGVRIEDIACITSTEPPYYEVFGPLSPTLADPLGGHN